MQRRKIEKISIFSSLDVIFNCLMSRVESASSDSTQDWYQVESWDSTWVLESSQNVNMKTWFNNQSKIEYLLIWYHIWIISRFQKKTSFQWTLQIIKKKTRSSLYKDSYI